MDVIDPSGSGDAFASGVIQGLLNEWDLPRTLRYASAMGASATRAPGTTESVFSRAEAEAFVVEHPLIVSESRI
jgi:sugar/nucleoside kinase (ribokinase family)